MYAPYGGIKSTNWALYPSVSDMHVAGSIKSCYVVGQRLGTSTPRLRDIPCYQWPDCEGTRIGACRGHTVLGLTDPRVLHPSSEPTVTGRCKTRTDQSSRSLSSCHSTATDAFADMMTRMPNHVCAPRWLALNEADHEWTGTAGQGT